MTANTEMIMVQGHSWRRGMRPMMRRENRKWWSGWRGFMQMALWALLLDGVLALALCVLPKLTTPDGQQLVPGDPFDMAAQMFFGMGILATAIGAIVLLQDAIIGEKESGTAEWVLSKPIARGAYVLAKLLPNLIAMLITMIVVPTAIGWLLFNQYDPGLLSLEQILKAEAIITLHLLFYITLTLMLGVVAKNRQILLSVAFGSLLGGSMVPVIEIVQFTPWAMGQIALSPILGVPLGSLGTTMLVSTGIWSLLFVIIAVWRFRQLEF